jgi:hypothetical protein
MLGLHLSQRASVFRRESVGSAYTMASTKHVMSGVHGGGRAASGCVLEPGTGHGRVLGACECCRPGSNCTAVCLQDCVANGGVVRESSLLLHYVAYIPRVVAHRCGKVG